MQYIYAFTCLQVLFHVRSAWRKRLSKGATTEDPLAVWLDYVRWIEDHVPAGGSKSPIEEALEEATSAFASDARYRNDSRYVALWVRLANLAKDPAPTFRYLWSKRIGEGCALFYMAWGHVAEREGRFTVAERVYSHGVRRGTDKRDRLAARHAMFRRRMVAKWRDMMLGSSRARGSSPADSASGVAGSHIDWKTVDLHRLEQVALGADTEVEGGAEGARAGTSGDGEGFIDGVGAGSHAIDRQVLGGGLIGDGVGRGGGGSAGAAAGAGGGRRRPLGVIAMKPDANVGPVAPLGSA